MRQHERDHRAGGGGGGGRNYTPPELTSDVPFQLDAKGEIFENSAYNWAVKWKSKGLTSTQLRNYYNELLAIYYAAIDVLRTINLKESALDEDDFLEKHSQIALKAWEKVELEFKLLKARSAYALRDNRDKKSDMVYFIQRGVEKVNDVQKLRKFKLYFEAAVAQFYYLEKA